MINLPADDTGQRLHPIYEIGDLMRETFKGVSLWQHPTEPSKAPDRAILAIQVNSGAEPGSEQVEYSAWNQSRRGILCGAGATSEAVISFP